MVQGPATLCGQALHLLDPYVEARAAMGARRKAGREPRERAQLSATLRALDVDRTRYPGHAGHA